MWGGGESDLQVINIITVSTPIILHTSPKPRFLLTEVILFKLSSKDSGRYFKYQTLGRLYTVKKINLSCLFGSQGFVKFKLKIIPKFVHFGSLLGPNGTRATELNGWTALLRHICIWFFRDHVAQIQVSSLIRCEKSFKCSGHDKPHIFKLLRISQKSKVCSLIDCQLVCYLFIASISVSCWGRIIVELVRLYCYYMKIHCNPLSDASAIVRFIVKTPFSIFFSTSQLVNQ